MAPATPPLPEVLYAAIIDTALREDLGRGGDLTTDAVVASELRGTAHIINRSAGCLCGMNVAAAVFHRLDPGLEIELEARDSEQVRADTMLMRIVGSVRSILTAERVALNFLGHLSGVATLTAEFVRLVAGTGARVVCTRKTTPGLRALEKYAVRCGGGANHRYGLDDAVLIKDNHVAIAGGIGPALERVRDKVGHTVKVEIEVDTLEQLDEVLAIGVDAVLLDNMSPDQLQTAVLRIDGRIISEASGGISRETAAAVAASGVDLLSIGALTHSAPSLDVSLEMSPHRT